MTYKILPTIKALPSFYAGVKFRSRLEARWARYFDLIGVEWEYEPEGYALPSGNYCPDFFCKFTRSRYGPTSFFVEVKPDHIGQIMVQQKLIELCQMTSEQVVCVVGNPVMKEYWCWEKDYDEDYEKESCGVSISKAGLERHGRLFYGENSFWGEEPFYEQASKMRFENGVACV
jgi:hypothetical protein